jgi:aspartyl-tRNA synthetase
MVMIINIVMIIKQLSYNVFPGEEVEKALQKRCHRLKNSMNRNDQSFKLHWTTDRPWLRYNEHEQMMYCMHNLAIA